MTEFFLRRNENSIKYKKHEENYTKSYLKLLKTSNKLKYFLKQPGQWMEGAGRGGHITERNKGEDGGRFCLKQCKSEDGRATSLMY